MSHDIDEKNQQKPPLRGRSWADVFVGTTYILGGALFLLISGFAVYWIFGRIPNWFFISILGSFMFIPFLFERAKDGSELFIVSHQPFKLTEYRIGRRTGLNIEGNAIQMTSKTGITRTFLKSLDDEKLEGEGSPFAQYNQIEQIRDLTTLQRLIDELESTLKTTRLTTQEVGVEVERQSIKIVDWALKTIYGAIVPTEISEAFGIKQQKTEINTDSILEVEEIDP